MPTRPLPKGVRGRGKATELANRLNSAAIHLLRRIARDDARDGITGARLSALSVIVYGGPQTTTELARREGVAAPTVTRIVDALVRDGLVRREGDAGDRRVVRLSATIKGRDLMERARARRIQKLARELEALAAADVERLEQAVDVLLKLEKEDGR
jgi:DNA-binding MarR family transcriptional regulator